MGGFILWYHVLWHSEPEKCQVFLTLILSHSVVCGCTWLHTSPTAFKRKCHSSTSPSSFQVCHCTCFTRPSLTLILQACVPLQKALSDCKHSVTFIASAINRLNRDVHEVLILLQEYTGGLPSPNPHAHTSCALALTPTLHTLTCTHHIGWTLSYPHAYTCPLHTLTCTHYISCAVYTSPSLPNICIPPHYQVDVWWT